VKVAVYYRVSTDRQDFASQEIAVRTWVEQRQCEKVLVYQDHAFSGASSRRPQYQKMRRDARKGRFDTLVVYRLDRLSRTSSEAIQLILELTSAGVNFVSVTQPMLCNTDDNPFRNTMLAMMADLAQVEREIMIRRVKDGLRAARDRGVKLGAPRKIDRGDLEQIEKWHHEGLSIRKIAERIGVSVGCVHHHIKNHIKPKTG